MFFSANFHTMEMGHLETDCDIAVDAPVQDADAAAVVQPYC